MNELEPDPSLLGLLRGAGAPDLDALGAAAEGRLTPAGVVALAAPNSSPPRWSGFRVATWPGPIVDRPRLAAPTEVRRLGLPTITMIDVLADEAALLLGERLPPALYDGVREAAAELLTNAVAHRDYTISAPIDVEQYTDAVRIRSPGAPAHTEITDGGFYGRGARNLALQHLLKLLGRGRQQGMGWQRCILLASGAGLSVDAQVRKGHTEVTLAIRPATRARLEAVDALAQERRLRLPGGTWDARLLDLVGDGEAWRPKDIQAALGIPRSTLTTVLRRLAKRGDIEPGRLAARSSRQTWRRAHSSPTSTPTNDHASKSSASGSTRPSSKSTGGEGDG